MYYLYEAVSLLIAIHYDIYTSKETTAHNTS